MAVYDYRRATDRASAHDIYNEIANVIWTACFVAAVAFVFTLTWIYVPESSPSSLVSSTSSYQSQPPRSAPAAPRLDTRP